MKPDSKEFKALQKTWYNKLSESGFVDQEDEKGELKQHTISRTTKSKNSGKSLEEVVAYNKSKEDYYRRATHFLNDYTFSSNLDKFIWTLHSDGVSERDIAQRITDLGFNRTKWPIRQAIERLRKEMNLFSKESDNE